MWQKMLQVGSGGESQDKYAMLNLFTGNVGNNGTASLNANYQLFEKIKFTFSDGEEKIVESSDLVVGSNYVFSVATGSAQLHGIATTAFPYWTSTLTITKVDGYVLGTEILE